jgi:DNA invertase Pin-like site-specific DNA recombinase
MSREPMRKRSFAKAGKGLMLGYARVSKGDEQTNTMQARALRAAGCRRIFEEAASGGRWDRPELHRLLDHLREEDTLVVWKLDRLSRSLKDVLHIMERIAAAGAGFRSLTENIDTTTPAGRMMIQMVAAFAEFERAMIRERTSAGLAAAPRRGSHRRAPQEVGCYEAPRDRRERHLGSQDRSRHGPALQRQRADSVTHRRRSPLRPGLACSFEQIVR